MKLDGESACCSPTQAWKSTSKSVEECNNIVNETVALETGEKLIKESQNEMSCGVKGNEKANSLSSQISRDGLWNVSEFDCSTSDDSTNVNEDEVRDFGEPYSDSSAQIGLYQNDMAESELPEIVVCYKESHENVIKDICIDQGVTSLGKILFGGGADDGTGKEDSTKSNPHDLKPSAEKDCCKDSANQCASMGSVQIDSNHNKENTKSATDDLKSSGEEDCCKDSANQCASVGSLQIDSAHNKEKTELTTDDLKPSAEEDCCKDSANQCASVGSVQIESRPNNVTEATKEKHVPPSIEPEEHLETEDFKPELSDNRENRVDKQSVQIPYEEAMSKNSTMVSAVEESNSSSNKSIVTPAPSSAVEESINSPVNGVSYDSKVEDGSITFNFGSCAPVSSVKEETSQPGDCEHLMTQNMAKHEDETSDSQKLSNQSRHSPGESSFAVAGPLSGLITYSGPIAYSGSCSLRSDSSTTSTRSFAFPVLQAEWNSSPVRMRKADRRKQKGWKEGLLCCRF